MTVVSVLNAPATGPSLPIVGERRTYVAVNAETDALVARFSTPPSNNRLFRIDRLIGSLKTAGVWSKLDGLYILAAHDAQAAQRNWIEDAFNLSPTNSPVFTADRGYAGNGSTSFLDSSFNPTTAAGAFALNSAYMALWGLNLSANGRAGNDAARLGWGSAPMHYSRANDGTTTQGSINAATRWVSFSRAASGSYTQRTNGADFATVSVTSTAMTNANFMLGQANGSFGAGPYCAWAFGSSLTQTQDAATYAAIRAYLVAVGAA